MIRKQYSMKSALRAVAVAAALGSGAVSAMACGSEPYIGEVCTFSFAFCPYGFVPANGQLLPVLQNEALFSLLGTTYGGDGRTTFGVPDLRNRTAVNMGTSDSGLTLAFGQKVGAVLNANSLPMHTHPVTVPANAITGSVSLPLSGSVANQTIGGSVSVNGLTTNNPPTGTPSAVPNSTNNTIGKAGALSPFYPAAGNTQVSMPTAVNLTVTGGTLSGNAAGNVTLPTMALPLISGPNAGTTTEANVPPRLAMSVCIATLGTYPTRDN